MGASALLIEVKVSPCGLLVDCWLVAAVGGARVPDATVPRRAVRERRDEAAMVRRRGHPVQEHVGGRLHLAAARARRQERAGTLPLRGRRRHAAGPRARGFVADRGISWFNTCERKT
ncbi:hypothetical protein ON010_g11498 [Phytophthora cinnamomi]|nr:hypothetical protein ON010_g11498 [Phytophthora cinnamomi]